ncbi:uncharacterized protein DNG_09455 [Cephalotrichum gorgonifer]|uniref:Uncharacterized protein n=1 Tax=Cephalotrichum gorgonifer TaxID=2041049 RepID=A0AAE8N5R0_9PEZI|nr:uncharacterized protein DNG_09455 [Cephalotrichum gorgonifer]
MALRRVRPWRLEIGAAAASIALIVVMVIVLAHFNGKPIFDSGVLRLNAIVSVLSTASKSFLLYVLAGSIGQWNWILFSSRPRRLWDFEQVADASRGPLGSVLLLFNPKFKGGLLVRLGALITILAIALDPFAQQLVQFGQEMRYTMDNGGASSLPFATRYSKGNSYSKFHAIQIDENGRMEALGTSRLAYPDADFGLQSATVFGITAERHDISEQLSVRCPSGDCRFPPVTSLAVCSRCEDLAPHLKRNTQSEGSQIFDLIQDQSLAVRKENCTEYTLPNGLFLNNLDDDSGGGRDMIFMTMSGTTNRSNTVVMGDIDTLIWAQTIIKVDGGKDSDEKWPNYDVHATECALYYCVRNYTAEVHNATLFETSTILEDEKRLPESWSIAQPDSYENISDVVVHSLAYHPVESAIERTDLQLGRDGSDISWSISQPAVDGISAYMQNTFASCLVGTVNCTDDVNTWAPTNGYLVGGELLSGQWQEQYEPSVSKTLWNEKDLSKIFDNVAMSMSNAIRNGADDAESKSGSIGVPVTVGNPSGDDGFCISV